MRLDNNMFIINAQNIRDKNIQLQMSVPTSTKRSNKKSGGAAVRIQVMPPSNMRNISCSLTNQIADILYVDDNVLYLFIFWVICIVFLGKIIVFSIPSTLRSSSPGSKGIYLICVFSSSLLNRAPSAPYNENRAPFAESRAPKRSNARQCSPSRAKALKLHLLQDQIYEIARPS